VGSLEVHVPIAGLIDVTTEIVRLEKQLKRLNEDIQGLSQKLSNPGFIDKAPTDVVSRERGRLDEAHTQLIKITAAISELKDS
jgi:valyl-tRNA synthetase